MYKVRVILDTKEDVIRTILVDDYINLETLHNTITNAFGFDGQEMASFYRTDDEWNQGDEIPLFNMAEAGEEVSMQTCILNETLPLENDKLIYVYDFLNMWTFLVELGEIVDEAQGTDYPNLMFVCGQVPSEAPEKQFEAGQSEEDYDNYRLDDYDELNFDEHWN